MNIFQLIWVIGVLTKSDCMGGGVGPGRFLILWVVVIPARKRKNIIC